MILRADDLDTALSIETDLCIVGAGPAGIAIALQFVGTGIDVVVLESGGRRPTANGQALCRGEVAEPALHPPADSFRRRGLGGSTTIWGGRCVPLDPIDFAPRDWLDLPGWPIDYADLLPHYAAAHTLCQLGAFDYSASTALPGGMRPMFPGFSAPSVTTDRIERFSCPTDFGRTYGPALARSRNVRVILHAVCTSAALEDGGQAVKKLAFVSTGGRRLTLRARASVLATGGLETPRLRGFFWPVARS
jgi:choline dehydrogenase-like flavoprotein